MIDKNKLNKLDQEIDELFEKETSDSLIKWLLNKRFGNIHEYVGEGKFVNLSFGQRFKEPIFVKPKKPPFKHKEDYSSNSPINYAA